MYIYMMTEKNVWTVGFYSPDDEWIPESDYSSIEEAEKRARDLNSENVEEKQSCEFCESADFSTFAIKANLYYTTIEFGGKGQFPKEKQFRFCPACGRKLI